MPVCPECGSNKSKEAPAEPGQLFVVVQDRLCECGHRYKPPTPAWAPHGMLVAGAALVIGAAALGWAAWDDGRVTNILRGGLAAIAVFVAGAGLLVVGLRMIASPDAHEEGLTIDSNDPGPDPNLPQPGQRRRRQRKERSSEAREGPPQELPEGHPRKRRRPE